MDSVGKYSVQNWDIYRLESGATTPRRGGGRLRRAWEGFGMTTMYSYLTMLCVALKL